MRRSLRPSLPSLDKEDRGAAQGCLTVALVLALVPVVGAVLGLAVRAFLVFSGFGA